jgi:hypothetical protein
MNLLRETIYSLKDAGQSTDDIVFIGSVTSGHSCNWEEFEKLADLEYDNDYGAQKIATDLIIVFKDSSHLQRWEYDGSEGWEYISKPPIPINKKKIARLIVTSNEVGWRSLDEMNKD